MCPAYRNAFSHRHCPNQSANYFRCLFFLIQLLCCTMFGTRFQTFLCWEWVDRMKSNISEQTKINANSRRYVNWGCCFLRLTALCESFMIIDSSPWAITLWLEHHHSVYVRCSWKEMYSRKHFGDISLHIVYYRIVIYENLATYRITLTWSDNRALLRCRLFVKRRI